MPVYDLIIRGARVVRPHAAETPVMDIAVKDGRFAVIAPHLPAYDAARVVEAGGRLAFPGLVDAHMHVGIYTPLAQDAPTESRAAAMGGVTSALTYFRTGQYYLNKGGSYADFYPEVLAISDGRYHVDYGYHLAPISRRHIGEMEDLLLHQGVSSFKIFMFYGGYGLHGKSGSQRDFLMIDDDERYDFAHFEFIMREASRLMQRYPHLADSISVSLHCEIADILNAYTDMVQKDGRLSGLHAYSAARPPHSEGLAVWIASYLAYETDCLNINLLHLSGRKALSAALMMQQMFPHIHFRREITVGHLLLDVDRANVYAKVNPPIRTREDVEFLWDAVLKRQVDWIVSDHACCSREMKVNLLEPDNIWQAKSGFGGTEYLLSGVYSEGHRRGMTPNHMAELLCWNPAQRYGLRQKGDIAVGLDADVVLFDPHETFTVRAADSPSGQGYTPFEGLELAGRVKQTFVRGHLVYDNGSFGPPIGQYLRRPQLVAAATAPA
jgi:allantoinase